MTDHELADEKLRNAVMALMEFCQTVQIIATVHNENGTQLIHSGLGNYYARTGSCQEFLDRERDITTVQVEENLRGDEYNEGEYL